MSKMTEELGRLLDQAGARVTFDSERDFTKPCFCCGEQEKPRTLERVGVWTRRVGNRGIAGDDIERPLCASCKERFPEGPCLVHRELALDVMVRAWFPDRFLWPPESPTLHAELRQRCSELLDGKRKPFSSGDEWALRVAAALGWAPPTRDK